MRTNKLAGSICALLLTALGASTAAAQTSTASIVFTRTVYRAIDGNYGSELYRIKPSGANTAQLAAVIYGTDYLNSSWSPNGASVVYQVAQRASQGDYFSSQLFVVDRQGGSPRQITTGSALHEQPLWAPNSGTIAYTRGSCLATVRADGTNQHTVFCAPREPGMMSNMAVKLLQWTPSGNGVLLVAGGDEGGLEPEKWYSDIYRVNVSTGLATKLASQVFQSQSERLFAIAPDRAHGVYDGNPMNVLDFASNTLTQLPTQGRDPTYSPDGRKIAFIVDGNVYLIHPDGSHLRALTDVGSNAAYLSIADWSSDSTRLLVNQIGDDRLLQIIDLRDNSVRTVTKGTADDHAWFHP